MARSQNLLFSRLLEDKVKQSGRLHQSLAAEAGTTDRTLSMLINGSRRPSAELAKRLAEVLGSGDKLVNEFLTAAGFCTDTGRFAILQLMSIHGLAERELAIVSGEVWIFCYGIVELSEVVFWRTLVANLKKKIHYHFFLNESNALDWLQLQERLKETGSESSLECVILSDSCYHTASVQRRRIYTLHIPESGSASCLQVFGAPEGLAYLEAHAEVHKEIFGYLGMMRLQADKDAQAQAESPVLLPAHHHRFVPHILKQYLQRMAR